MAGLPNAGAPDAGPDATPDAAPDARDPARAELAALDDALAATDRAWRALAGALSPAQFNWRPAPGRWSVGEHLAHLNLVDASYLPHLDAMIARGRLAGLAARGRPRHPWLGRSLVRGAGPPVALRVRTSAPYVPPSRVDRDAALAAFAEGRRALRARVAAADGLDPGRGRARPAPGLGPARWVTLSFGQWIALTAAHDRRHLWLAERVAEAPGFPAG